MDWPWQDYAITVAQLLMAVALIPALQKDAPLPKLSTSVPTALGLVIMGVTFLIMEYWLSSFFVIAMTIMWSVIAWGRLKLDYTN